MAQPPPAKKVMRQNSSVITSLLNQGVIQTPVTPKPEPTDGYTPAFFQEISDIMRGFGDCETPVRESVVLVEKIMLQQMRAILHDVIDLAIERKRKPEPSQKDFEYLMRRNPLKIYRLQKHLKDLEFRRRYQDMLSGRASTLNADEADKSDEDPDHEVAEKYDEEKVRRLFRADRISLTLNGNQYLQYNEARRTSFHSRNSYVIRSKLKTMLNPPPEAILSTHVFTILGFLVHETIATIVDYAILTRLNSNNRDVDPYHRVTSSGASYSMLHICPEVTQGRGMDGIKPITVPEIQEALRRHASEYNKPMGMHRNMTDRPHHVPYLAI